MRTVLLVFALTILAIMFTGCATGEYPQIKECSKACKKSNMKQFEDDTVSCGCFQK